MKRSLPERLRHGAGRFIAISVDERIETARLLVLLVAVEGALRALPLASVARVFGVGWGASNSAASDDVTLLAPAVARELELAARRVDRVLRIVRPESACLRRSLLLGHELRRHHPVLRIGVARRLDEFEAHAWLELNGVRVPDSAHGRATHAEYVALRPFL